MPPDNDGLVPPPPVDPELFDPSEEIEIIPAAEASPADEEVDGMVESVGSVETDVTEELVELADVEMEAEAEVEAAPAVPEPRKEVSVSVPVPAVPPRRPPPRPNIPIPSAAEPGSGLRALAGREALAQFEKEGGPERLALFEKELARETDRERQALLEYEIGELLEAAGDEAAAAKRYGKALVADPALRPNLWALKRICERRGAWPNVIKLIDAEIKFARSETERADLWVDRGLVLADRMGDAAGGRAAFEQALELKPTSLRALMALEKVLAREGDPQALAALYRRTAEATEDVGRRQALLIDLARLEEAGGAGQDAEAAAASREASVDQALEVLREALALDGEAEPVLLEIEWLAERHRRPEALLEALEGRARRLGKQLGTRSELPEHDQRLAGQIAALRQRQAQVVGDPARAWDYLMEAHRLLPEEPLLLIELCDLGQDLGRFAELAELLGARLAMAPEALRPRLLLEQAEAMRLAGREAEAEAVEAELASQAAPAAPADGADGAEGSGDTGWSLFLLRERHALARGDVRALAALRSEEAERALAGRTPSGQADAAWGAAALTAAGSLQERAGDAEAAMVAYRRALTAVPGYRPAIDALDLLYARTGRYPERLQLLEAEMAGGATGPRAEYLLEELLELRVSQGETAEALAVGERLCALRQDVASRARLVELCRVAGRWSEAASHLERLAEALATEGAAAHLERAAEAKLERAALLERHLGAADQAIVLLEEVAAATPMPVVFGELERLYQVAGRHEELAGLRRREIALLQQADQAEQAEQLARRLLELGDLLEHRLGRPDEAAEVYRDVLARTPGNVAALRALVRLAERAGDVAGLVQVMESAIETLASPVGQARALLRLGEILEDRLGKAEQAEEAYARSLGRDPSAHAAYGRWRARVRRREFGGLEDALREVAPFVAPEAAPGLTEERVWLGGDASSLLESLAEGQVAGVAAGSEGGAGPLALDLARWRLAARRGDSEQLAQAIGAVARRTSDAALAAALHLREAALLGGLGKDARVAARAALERAGADPQIGAQVLIAACEFLDEPEVLGKRRELVAPGQDPAQASAAARGWRLDQIEALLEQGRLAEAAAEAEAALAETPQDLGLLALLRRLARAAQDRRGEARVTARLAGLLEDRDRAAELLATAAATFEELGDGADAALTWMEVVRRRPGGAGQEAYERAHAVLERLEDGGALEALLGERLGQVEDPGERMVLLGERAELRRRHGQPRAAMADLEAVLEIDPQETRALYELGQLRADDGDLQGALALYERLAAGCNDAGELRMVFLRMAELAQASGDPASAIAHLQQALAQRPEDREIIEQLATLYEQQGQAVAAVDQLKALARLTRETADRVRIELRIAKICGEGMGDARGAVEAMTRALELDPLQLDVLGKLVPTLEGQGQIALKDTILRWAAERARSQIAAEKGATAPGLYRVLERVLALQGDEDARLWAGQCVAIAAGEPTPPRLGVEPSRELSAAAWERVFSPLARGLALEVWREARDAVPSIFGPELSAFGVTKNDRQNVKGLPSTWIPVDKIVRALGAGNYELYLSVDRPDLCTTVGPALVVGAAYGDRLTAATRFRVTRVVALMRERLGPLDDIDDTDLELYFVALGRCSGASWMPESRLSEARIEDRVKLLNKYLDRRARKALQTLAPRFAELGDVRLWRREILTGVAQLGLAVSGDLSAAHAELKVDIKGGLGQALARFAVSEDMAALRRELGLRG